jgi:RimJ/RimL family protein N-acetyltransferase
VVGGVGTITGQKVRLRRKRLSDAKNDYAWQTNPELAQLDAAPLLTVPYERYVVDYTAELRWPTSNRRIFAIETLDGKHIGNCVCYNIDERKGEAEIGIMLGDRDCWDQGYGTDAVNTLINHVFSEMKVKRLYLKTLELNYRAQRCFEKAGFIVFGRMNRGGYDFLQMELHRSEWEAHQQSLLSHPETPK